MPSAPIGVAALVRLIRDQHFVLGKHFAGLGKQGHGILGGVFTFLEAGIAHDSTA